MNRLFLALSMCILTPAVIYADIVPTSDPKIPATTLQPISPANNNSDLQKPIELAPLKITPKRFTHLNYSTSATTTKYANFLSYVSPEYKMRKKVFLVRGSITRSKRAFTFVFLMNNRKKDAPKSDRKHMHILWTGSKKMFKEHKVIENEYPVDVTMAQYNEGYAPGEWNLILPNKKPKEVQIAFLWTF